MSAYEHLGAGPGDELVDLHAGCRRSAEAPVNSTRRARGTGLSAGTISQWS